MRRTTILLALLLIGIAPVATAQTQYVTISPGDSITETLANLNDGDYLKLNPGVYNERLVINKEIRLIGEGEGATINATGPWTVRVAANNVAIHNIHIEGGSRDSLLATGVDRLQLTAVSVDGATGSGIELRELTHVTLRDVTVTGSGVNAIRIMDTDGANVINSEIRDNFRGIHFKGVYGGSIQGTTVTGTDEHGIVVEDSRGTGTYFDNTVTDNQFGIWFLGSDNSNIYDNIVTGTEKSAFGVLMQDVNGATLTNTQVSNIGKPDENLGNAIEVRFSSRVHLEAPIIDNAGSNAIRMASTSNSYVHEGIITNSFRAIHFYEGNDVDVKNTQIGSMEEHGIVAERGSTFLADNVTVQEASIPFWFINQDDVTIQNSIIQYARAIGVRAENLASMVIKNTDMRESNPESGIGFSVFNATTVDIQDSRVANLGMNGFSLEHEGSIYLANNVAENTGRAMHLRDTPEITVIGNTIDETGEGIVIERSGNFTATNNDVTNGNIGIWVRGNDNQRETQLTGNTIQHFQLAGVVFDQGLDGAVLDGNDIRFSEKGVQAFTGSHLIENGILHSNTCDVWTDNEAFATANGIDAGEGATTNSLARLEGESFGLFTGCSGVANRVGISFTPETLGQARDEMRSLATANFDDDEALEIFYGTVGWTNYMYDDDLSEMARFATRSSAHDSHAVDYDFDGDMDVITGFRGGWIGLFRNDNGNFGAPEVITDVFNNSYTDGNGDERTGYNVVSKLQVIDMDFDGDYDIVAVDMGRYQAYDSHMNVVWNNGDGTYAVDEYPMQFGGMAYGIEAIDFDGDEDIDVFSTDADGNLYYWTNDGNGAFTGGKVGTDMGSVLNEIAVADFDGDGALEVLGVQNQGQVVLIEADWTHTVLLDHDIHGQYGMEVADIDGDGDLDAAVSLAPAGVMLLLNHGDSWEYQHIFVDPEERHHWGGEAISDDLNIVDWNFDGKLDIVTASSSENIYVLLQD